MKFSIDGMTPEQTEQELQQRIEESDYFKNTLIFGIAAGNLGVRKTSPFGQRMFEFLEQEVRDYITQDTTYQEGLLHMDLRRVVQSPTKYKPELVSRLTELIESLLKK